MQSKKIILSMDWHDKDHQERGNLRNREITPAQLAAIQYILHSPDLTPPTQTFGGHYVSFTEQK